jgi:hypothetical protein
MTQTRILVNYETRNLLKKIGAKGQTYDEIINHLIKIKIDDKILDKG